MYCPYCGKENPPENLYCSECNVLLPTLMTKRRQKVKAFFHAVLVAITVIIIYYGISSITGILWQLRFMNSIPSGITQEELVELFNSTYAYDSGYLDIIIMAALVLLVAIFYRIKGSSLSVGAGIRKAPTERIFAALAVGLSVHIPMGIILGMIPFPKEIIADHQNAMTSCTSPMYIQILAAVIIAPFIEEILFRGLIHDRFAKALPFPVAALISSLIFGSVHGGVIAMLVAFVLGLFLSYLYSRFNSILVPMAFHAGFNAVSYLMDFITDPVLMCAAVFASLAIFIGGAYLLLRKERIYE